MRAFNVARPRQRNIYQITSPTTCNLHAYRQVSGLRLNSFFISTILLSFEQLIHLDYFIWWRDGFLVARWFLGGELVGGETPRWRDDRILWQGIETIKHIHNTYDTHLPPLYLKIEKMKIERAKLQNTPQLKYHSESCYRSPARLDYQPLFGKWAWHERLAEIEPTVPQSTGN